MVLQSMCDRAGAVSSGYIMELNLERPIDQYAPQSHYQNAGLGGPFSLTQYSLDLGDTGP